MVHVHGTKLGIEFINYRVRLTLWVVSIDNVDKNIVNDYLREISEKELKAAQKVLDIAGVKHNIVIMRGHVADEIMSLANKDKVDMIVMGAKGRSGFLDILMGSVAQRVCSIAKQPVLLIK